MVLIMLIGVIIFILTLMGGGVDEFGNPKPNISAIDAGLYLSYIILVLSLVIAVVFSLVNMLMNPKKSMGTVVGLVAAIVVYFISSSMSSDVVPELWTLKDKVLFSPSNVKFADTGLYMTYAFGVISLLAIVFGELFTFFKKYIAK